jgi:fatty acid synthase subunit alpha
LSHEHSLLRDEVRANKDETSEDYLATRIADIEQEARRQEQDALATYGMLEGIDPRISPLRRALAVWGLTADDIGVLSIHGTSTGANVSARLP